MDKCYLCGNFFNENTVKKHDEHIIQQAIGGNLTKDNILCSLCGGKLGQDIDANFNKIFDEISTRMDIKRDRQGNKKSSVKGTMGHIDVIWKNNKVSPVQPFHLYTIDKKLVVIYANQKTAKKYKLKVEKEIKENITCQLPKIIVCDDMEGIVQFPFNINDQVLKKGLAKIAIGFASSCGIKRENMPLALEINENTNEAIIRNKILAIPFYPLGVIDELIEVQKNEFGTYPFHNIILFTINHPSENSNGKKVLICYIELFATFQWYVVLNEEYCEDSVYKYYSQQILKKYDYMVELGRRYYKERNIWLQPLGITEEYIDKKYNNQKYKILSKLKWSTKSDVLLIAQQPNIFLNLKNRSEIEYEIIQEESIKQKYKFDFEGYINNAVNRISNQFLIFKDRNKSTEINKHVTKFLDNEEIVCSYNNLFDNFEYISTFKNNLGLFYQLNYEENEVFSIYNFRVFYCKNNKLKNYYSELLEQLKNLIDNGKLKAYNHKKMHMLENYIQQENIKQKPNKS